ncbi:type 2 lanthipeptide synthetase LanM family protein, partial [Actinophytocola xanthii]|uniref:type 2 lanthipeptide synthetase LanM family protein n=1 Tax=Actinophytocola xanthii TaxID=1912961 RepID=UPI0018E9E95A
MSPATRTAAVTGTAGAGLADPAWWAPGVALHERGDPAVPGAVDGRGSVGDPAGNSRDPAFAARLSDLGVADTASGGSPADLARRLPRPAWAALAERAVRAARPLETHPPEPRRVDWRFAFARVLDPFVAEAATAIRAGTPGSEHVDLDRVAEGVGAALGSWLVDIAVRTLVTELHRWRAEDRLDGDDGRARFDDFVRQLTTPPGLGEVLGRYPVLARLLAQATSGTVAATLELLARFGEDRAELVRTLLGGTDPGALVALHGARGDRHAGGRSVTLLEFAGGALVVYKPRDLAPQVCFTRFLDRLEGLAPGLFPRSPALLARPGYGWSEHVPARPLTDRAGADRFYRRQGALLALLHGLRATDVHYENLIAHGDQPVLVDVETLFQPDLSPAGPGDPAADALAASVHRTALLPLVTVGEQGMADLSGLGGDPGHSPSSVVDWLDPGTDRMRLTRRTARMAGAANRPRLDGREVDPANHEQALLAGFRQAYDTIAAHRGELAELAAEHADLRVRVVTRPTWVYGTLLDETTHPDVLADALDRDRALAVLHQGRTGEPLVAQLLAHEVAALWAGDVPLFTAGVGDGRLRTAEGAPLPVPLPRTGLAAARETLAGLGEVDRRDQEWVVSATLATRRRAGAHPVAAPVAAEGAAAHPDELLAAACAVADRLVAGGLAADGRVNWLGLEVVERRQWLVLPLGASLGSGYLGVAVFLAQLAALTGIGRYADQAHRAVGDTPALVHLLATRPDLVTAIGCGGLHGLGGIAFGLARLGSLLDDQGLREAAAAAVPLAVSAATPAAEAGWAGGLAGCLAALSAVGAELDLDITAGADRCATELTGRVDRALEPVADDGAGFGDGLAGVGWALSTFGPDPVHRAAGQRAVTRAAAGGTDEPGWCRGR